MVQNTSELIPPDPLAVDILRIMQVRNAALQRLAAAKIPAGIISDFATVYGLDPDTCNTLPALDAATKDTLYNPISGTMYEDRARRTILDNIVVRVINGEDELAVIETDVVGLKGLNDDYGGHEADKAIREYVEQTRATLAKAIQDSGREVRFAIVNKYGQKSDSTKIVLMGKELYHFTQEYVRNKYTRPVASVRLKSKVDEEEKQVDISGNWGFFVARRNDSNNIFAILKLAENTREKAGDLYTLVSGMASIRLDINKVRDEAALINEALSARNLTELEPIWDKVETFGPRIPQVVVSVMRKMMKLLKNSGDQSSSHA